MVVSGRRRDSGHRCPAACEHFVELRLNCGAGAGILYQVGDGNGPGVFLCEHGVDTRAGCICGSVPGLRRWNGRNVKRQKALKRWRLRMAGCACEQRAAEGATGKDVDVLLNADRIGSGDLADTRRRWSGHVFGHGGHQIRFTQVGQTVLRGLRNHLADMEGLAAIARARRWTIVEDACHALGAEYRTRDGAWHPVGACRHSAMCCFSFHAVKHITTGEGGAVTTNDEALYQKLLRFRTHGITREPAALTRDEGPWYYEQHELGFNYRITDLQCALGLSQLKRLGTFVSRRRALAARYDAAFAAGILPEVRPLGIPAGSKGSYHLYVIRVPAGIRRALFEELRALEIGVNVHYLPVYRHPYYQQHGFAGVHLPRAEQYYAEAITLPLFPAMADADVDRVVHALALAFERLPAAASA